MSEHTDNELEQCLSCKNQYQCNTDIMLDGECEEYQKDEAVKKANEKLDFRGRKRLVENIGE
jgi:hypothetical protein